MSDRVVMILRSICTDLIIAGTILLGLLLFKSGGLAYTELMTQRMIVERSCPITKFLEEEKAKGIHHIEKDTL